MRNTLRACLVTLLTAPALAVMAQPAPPYTVTIYGSVSGCTPNSSVNIVSVQGTQPAIDIDVPVDTSNCMYSVSLEMDSPVGWFMISTMCQGAVQSQSASYQINGLFPDSTMVYNSFDCGGIDPCVACMEMVANTPFTGLFTSCSGGEGPLTYIWDFSFAGAVNGDSASVTFPGPGSYTACLNVLDATGGTCNTCETVYVDPNGGLSFDPPTGCQACLTVTPVMNGNTPVPFQANFTDCSSGAPTLDHLWWLPNGLNSDEQNQTFTFQGPGVYGVCLDITDGMGCESTVCDTVVVDANGGINTIPAWYDCEGILWGPNTVGAPCNNPVLGEGTWNANCQCVPDSVVYDCLQIPNGPNVPGSPCQQNGLVGTWSANCTCEPNTPADCNADFWIIQAYGPDSLPVPNELWVWNLTNGGSGLYQFFWDFGDGSVSTTAFPTHVYPDGGPYLLCLTITDSEGCTDTHCDSLFVDEDGLYNGFVGDGGNRSALTINVVNPLTMDIPENSMMTSLELWPNPARERLNIRFDSRFAGTTMFEVVDLNGRVVLAQQSGSVLGQNRTELGIEALSSGIYALRISQGRQVITQRFVRD